MWTVVEELLCLIQELPSNKTLSTLEHQQSVAELLALLHDCSYLSPSMILWCLAVPVMTHKPTVLGGILAFLLLTPVEN